MKNSEIKVKALSGIFWNMATNIGVQIVSFFIQVVLARILEPSAYGTIALVTIFVAVANVFVTTGYASALIQRKEVTDLECSTAFYTGLAIAGILYLALFFCSPFIAAFYEESVLIPILRIQSLTLIFGALTSVHNAIIYRSMQFKIFFTINLSGVIVQGVLGITMALSGFGVWALVASYTANRIMIVIMTWLFSKWRPKLMYSLKAFKELFSFSSKLLIMTLLDVLYSNVRSLIIGKKYSAESLAYYNRGNQIPTLIENVVLGSVNSVLFPALSRCQGNGEDFKNAYRRVFKVFYYISFPVCLGLFAISEPITIVLLTEKWRDSVIFMQLMCIVIMFNPFFVRSHVYNASGRSDVSMWLSVADKVVITVVLVLSICYGDIYMLVLSAIFSNAVAMVIGWYVNSKILGYKVSEQIKDFLPSFLLSAVVFAPLYFVNALVANYYTRLIIQITSGGLLYFLGSYLLKIDGFIYIIDILGSILRKPKKLSD